VANGPLSKGLPDLLVVLRQRGHPGPQATKPLGRTLKNRTRTIPAVTLPRAGWQANLDLAYTV
jgi:hypothetical protein